MGDLGRLCDFIFACRVKPHLSEQSGRPGQFFKLHHIYVDNMGDLGSLFNFIFACRVEPHLSEQT